MRAEDRVRLLRVAEAYRAVFMLPTGDSTPHGATVLRDLALFTGMYTGAVPTDATQATVMATLHAVYAHIMQMLNTRSDDIPTITQED